MKVLGLRPSSIPARLICLSKTCIPCFQWYVYVCTRMDCMICMWMSVCKPFKWRAQGV